MAAIPRGIQQVIWKNQDKTKQIRFRVRIIKNKIEFEVDNLFETLEESIAFLAKTKTENGRAEIKNMGNVPAVVPAATAIQNIIKSTFENIQKPNFGKLFDIHYQKEYVDRVPANAPQQKFIALTSYKSSFETIKSTMVEWQDPRLAGVANLVNTAGGRWGKKKLADFLIEEITETEITSFIEERLKTPLKRQKIFDSAGNFIVKLEDVKYISKATVRRELNILSAFFNNLKYENKTEAAKIKTNPVAAAKLKLLKCHNKKRNRRLGEVEETALLVELNKCQNPDMLSIFAIAISTGMRRSEVLNLTKSSIKENHIFLGMTKTGDERNVFLSAEAKEILKELKERKKTEKLFDYTIHGFNTNWQRVKRNAKVVDFRLHDLRREFISRVLMTIHSGVVVSEMIGMQDAQYFERAYKKPFENGEMLKKDKLESEEDLQSAVGQKSKNIMKRYTTLQK